jgi:hypothetical protein
MVAEEGKEALAQEAPPNASPSQEGALKVLVTR